MDLTNTVWRECVQQHSQLKQSKKQILKPTSPATQFQKSCYEVVSRNIAPHSTDTHALTRTASMRASRHLRNFWKKIVINI